MARSEANITRFEYGGTQAWWVRFQRGDKSNVTSKLFSDSKHGGKRKALAAARLFAEQLRAELPPPRRRQQAPGPGSFARRERRFTTASGEVKKYRAWEAWIMVAPGRVAATKWSIDKWGSAVARKRVMQWLEKKRLEQRRNFRSARTAQA